MGPVLGGVLADLTGSYRILSRDLKDKDKVRTAADVKKP
jgi:hypothetical protein